MTHASNIAIGLDIGGTKISACIVDENGHASFMDRTPTPSQSGPNAILDAAANLAQHVIGAAGVSPAACGLGSAGTFNSTGRVVYATNHLNGWAGTDVSSAMEERLKIPAVAVNDVHAAALGELWFGSARGLEWMAFVAVGTGIGGAIIADGRVLRGNSGAAGAVGHLHVAVAETRICSCGGRNHLEAFASGPAIERTFRETSGSHLGLQAIGNLARLGDAAALSAIQLATDLLADALIDLVMLTDSGTIVLGGGVLGLGELFLDPIADRMRSGLQMPFAGTSIRAASLRNTACMLGAGALALRHIGGEGLQSTFV